VTADPAGAVRDTRPGRRPSSAAGRLAGALLIAVALVLALAGTDAGLLSARVHRVPFTPTARAADTWVLVGLDARTDLPPGSPPAAFGTADDVPGARADVVVVLTRTAQGLRALSVPRDVVVATPSGSGRLALSWLHGPASTVAGLCRLGIPTGHLVTVDLAGFAAVVDAVGGVDVDVPAPVRDPLSGLDLATAGRRHLDGRTALALVRSRHPEGLVDGRWVPAAPDPDGRAAAAGTVLQALAAAGRASTAAPWRLQGLAWAASGALGVDDGTAPAALAGLLGRPLASVDVLPVGPPVGETLARFPTAATRAAVRAAGLTCGG
jgi:LCP family protein required for cell wall assembly